ncbi:MAG: translocation/assembly module TamB domain-containing protein [Holophagales bacterium]|nr:translocation/assembly module TamB domain-containing protein [Holophagales bacterium]
MSGRLDAASLPALASGRLADGRLHAAGPDLAAALAELHALFPALAPAAPADLELHGPFRVDVRAAGALRAPKGELDAVFTPARGGTLSLQATVDAARRSAEGRLQADGLSLGTLRPGSTGLASADARFALGPGKRDLHVTLDASGLCLAEGLPLVESLHASFEADASELRLFELAASASAGPGASPDGTPGARLEASGRASLETPLGDADVDATVSAGALSAGLRAFARAGVLTVDVPRAGVRGFEAILAARLPLGALAAFPALASRLPHGLPQGPLELTLDAPGLDSCALEGLLPAGTPILPLVANVRAFATFDLTDPVAGTAEVAIEGIGAETAAGHLALSGPARITLGAGRLALEEITVEGARTSFSASVSADLLPGARLGGPLSALVASLAASARGRADAALLAPFLAGGTASGEIALDARASGPPGALVGSVFIDGASSRFSWPMAWPTEIRGPTLRADLAPGSASLTRADAYLNGGPLLLAGGWTLDEGVSLTATFSDVRYRARLRPGGRSLGGADAGRARRREEGVGPGHARPGLLERDVDLDREILARILAPPEATGTEASLLDTLALEVGVGTASGVRIRNNVANLSASWSRLDVTGTARRPVVRGRIDVESGGLVYAYGQTFRIDKGAVTYAGDPATDPRLEFVTTSSLQDRSIGARNAAGDVFAEARPKAGAGEGDVDAAAELARGLAGYYGDRLASRLGSALGPVSLSVQPLFLLGETDQTARLTLSRAFSPSVSLAVSVDLKNAQRQTWVVDVHGVRGLPPLATQVFTEDYGRFGGSLQQRIEFGGSRIQGEDAGAPRLAALTITPPPGVPRRALVSAVGLRRGDSVGRARLFEAEIDAEAFLRSRGFPEVRVTMRSVPAKKAGRVDLEAGIDLGPRVEIAFEGDPLPASSRKTVAALYRTGTPEKGALEEMRLESVRALRALGHLAPEVEVTAGGDEARRQVVVRARAGTRTAILQVAFEGVSAREALLLARRFSSPLERIELAASLPSADRRLLQALLGLGYPAGRILDRTLEDGGRLAVRVDPGLPSLVASVEVRGVPAEEAGRLSCLARVTPGDPADADRTALSALAMEDVLRAGGFAGARVRTTLSPATPEDPPRLAVVFDVTKGPAESLGSVSFEGLSRTSPSLARRVADLPAGSPFLREEVDRARGELFALGLFRSVKGETAPGPDGRVDVVLKAEELPPLTVAYGLRWENERGLAAVVDVADRNVFGRGLTLGTRVLYDPDDRAVRAFAGIPERILGVGLDVWVERRRFFRTGLYLDSQTDSTEASIQLSRSVGRSLSARLYGKWKESRYFEDDPFFPLDVTTTFPYVGTQLVWDTREDPLLGTRGLLASVDLQGSGSWLGSDFSYARVYGQVNFYHPVFAFGSGRAVWAQSARAGTARAFDGQELIPDVRFYAGGSYSVRGYPTETLGPQEDLGGTLFATGGSTLLVVNEELRVPLHPRLLGVAFFDVGQVWASSRDFGTGLATSVGLGVRALTPLGVLRLDGAVPLNRREGDPAWKVTFGFGNVF